MRLFARFRRPSPDPVPSAPLPQVWQAPPLEQRCAALATAGLLVLTITDADMTLQVVVFPMPMRQC